MGVLYILLGLSRVWPWERPFVIYAVAQTKPHSLTSWHSMFDTSWLDISPDVLHLQPGRYPLRIDWRPCTPPPPHSNHFFPTRFFPRSRPVSLALASKGLRCPLNLPCCHLPANPNWGPFSPTHSSVTPLLSPSLCPSLPTLHTLSSPPPHTHHNRCSNTTYTVCCMLTYQSHVRTHQTPPVLPPRYQPWIACH